MSHPVSYFFAISVLLILFPGMVLGQDIAQADENIARQVNKLVQYPNRAKSIEEIQQDFQFANKSDLETILQLKETGQPDIWYKIFLANERIKSRQDLIKTLPGATVQKLGLTFVDNSRDLEEARSRATLYSYAMAEKLLADKDQASARTAYIELLKVVRLKDGKYRDLDKLMRKAILVGSTGVVFELTNRSGKNLTSDIVGRLNQIVSEYKKAQAKPASPGETVTPFNFTLRVVIDEVTVSPDQIKGLTYGEERDIYDNQGQVVDTIRCTVNEYRQLKKATIKGRVDFYDNQVGRVVNVIPISVESVFSNAFASIQGDPDAAGESTMLLLQSKQAAYPAAEQMVLDATDEFVKKVVEVILAE